MRNSNELTSEGDIVLILGLLQLTRSSRSPVQAEKKQVSQECDKLVKKAPVIELDKAFQRRLCCPVLIADHDAKTIFSGLHFYQAKIIDVSFCDINKYEIIILYTSNFKFLSSSSTPHVTGISVFINNKLE